MAFFVIAVAYVLTGRDAAPATRVGSAAVTLADDPARMVERVTYSDVVERVGDVVLDDGRPVSELEPGDVADAWAVVDAVWPDSRKHELVQLSVVRDGPLGLVGVVHLSTGGGWILSVDAADVASRSLMEETIAHELVHVVTLAPDRFSFGDGDCGGVRVELGCAARDSTLARFAERFWPDGDPTDPTATAFVTDYADTAVHEDLAETFTAWVFDWPGIQVGPVAQKVAVLADDPELVALREEVLSSLGSS